MATVLGNPPMRLRQLLSSGEGMMRPLVKLDTDPPPKIKDFIDRVIKCPLSDIAAPLSSFSWEYNKGNFHHWRPLFLHFDTYFKTYISCRKDLLLSNESLEEDAPFPKYEVLLILRVIQAILENCPNKSSFSGLEHFNHLLASTDPDILLAALQTLNALVKINPSKLHVSGKMIGCGSLNSILLSLAQGWGSKEEGLGLFGCVLANEQRQTDNLHILSTDPEKDCRDSHYRLASTLHFEFRPASDELHPSSLCTIHIPDIHKWQDDDLAIMRGCIKQYKVPLEQRFSLFSRIRFARAMRSPIAARDYSKICLLAFIALVQSNDAHDELVAFFANEPEFTNELLKLVRSDNAAVPEEIRTLAVVALGAQLTAYSSSHERARVLSGSSVIAGGAVGNRMVLLGVLQKAVISLGSSSDASCVSFVSALLHVFLLHVISSSSSGSSVRGSGLVPALLPLLQDVELSHMHLVCSSVKILQKLMDYSNAAVSLFKDLGGVDLLIQRLQVEINRVLDAGAVNRSPMVIGDASISGDDIVYTQKHLIKALLKALGSATYAPTNFGRSQNSYENTLPASLAVIFRNTEKFGGDIYFSAVTVMNEIIHKDPTCFSILYEAGLPDAFLFSVVNGVLPSAKAVSCIPSGLGAICLNAKGLEAVKEHNALHFLMEVCTSRKYLVAMNEGIVSLANALEELLRHVSTLRSIGVDIIIEIIEKLAAMEDRTHEVFEKEMPMETDAEEKVNEGDAMDSDGVSAERFFQLCVFHVMLLIHRTMENAETCRLFVEKKGLEAMIKLLLLPNIAQSSEGLSTSMYTASVFRGFTQQHSGPLAQVFCSSLRSHLRKTLSLLNSDPGLFVLNPQAEPDREMFSSLFVVEYLLFLIDASKENRWLTALLNEFGNDSKDVLEDMGRLHRDVLWQISVLEDSKVDIRDGGACSSVQSQKSDLNAHDSGDQRLSSFRQFLDPLLRRRLSGFGVESQFLDFVSLYNDVSRASGIQRRLGIDALSNMRIGSNQSQLQVPISSDGVSTSKSEGEQQRSFYTSCCDMMKSLCFHVSHLFLELGKVMVLPSRRRDDATTLSPSAKSVLSTLACIILDDLNFGGHVDPSRSEALVSTKCRYIRKIIDFIDVILLDRPDSCNPIYVNCFYSYGVVQAILTTFDATTQLLFAVNRVPASPMETEDADIGGNEKLEMETSWIYGALGSYCLLIDHLVTSSFILAPFTKHLLVQPLTSRSTSRDPEAFVRILQSKALKTVVPIWNHPHFSECSYEFISAIISIIRHIYSGVEVKNLSNGIGTRISGPPPDESSISMIVEMGFSRTRAEEALRQVGTNSVEMAMEWLFSHPEETQEDDELARALAMSLGNASSLMADDMAGSSSNVDQEEENVHLPPVDELLSSSLRLLETRENLAYPVKDLLVMICSQNDGHHRNRVISFIVEHLKVSHVVPDTGSGTMLSALFHVLALVLHEDATAREVAAKSGLALVSLDLLSMWEPHASDGEKPNVPKWVTASLLSMDQMLQVETKWNPEIFGTEQLKKDGNKGQSTAVHENGPNNLNPSTSAAIQLSASDQKRLVEIICKFIWKQIPSETMHVVLQLCATLTRDHSIAVSFLESGGLVSLLSLPTDCLFPGFDSIAATIIRHILEDPQTLQQAMEFEIRHTLMGSLNRHPSGRMTPRNFLSSLASVVCREPSIFMLAAQSVCQIEMVGDRPYVVLLKDREKEKGKDKDRSSERDKLPNTDNKLNSSEVNPVPLPGNGHAKSADGNSKTSKAHRKPPQSFVSVIDLLLDSIVAFVPSQKEEGQGDGNLGASSSMEMDIDVSMNKGKGKAVATVPDEIKLGSLEAPASLAKVVFILKLLSEILLTYSSSVHILLRKDAEIGSFHGQHQRDVAANRHGGIFHHVLHSFLSCSVNIKKDKKVDSDWRHKLATRAGQFLVAAAVRSAEGRKRIFTEINSAFIEFVDAAEPFVYMKPNCEIQAFVDLLNEIIAARSPTGSYISSEAASTFIDAGLVQSMTKILQVLDLDHADAPKLVSGSVKALESVTKEHVHSVDSTIPRGETFIPSTGQIQTSRADGDGNNLQSLEDASQPDDTERAGGPTEPFSGANISGGSDSVADDMDHEHDINGSFVPENEDDFMHDNSEEAGGLHTGADGIGISFGIEQGAQDNLIEEDDDEEMSSDGGEEVDEDEDEDDDGNDELDEDEVHHLSHPDTDQDDHEVDEDEFDEDVMEEDDEDDENGLILRLEDGINGINVLDHIEVFGRDNFSNDALHVMPVEVFGSRRPGRTTSIYNLLGRAGDNGIPIQHPLLLEPSASSNILQRRSDNAGGASSTDQNFESFSAHLDAIFRSLRSGRQGNRLNIWTEDGQVRGASNAAMVTQSMEEFFVTRLRKPSQVEPSTKLGAPEQPSHKGDGEGIEEPIGQREEPPNANSGNESELFQSSNLAGVDGNRNADTGNTDHVFLQEGDLATSQSHGNEMQYERNDAVPRDVEAVSQESGGSGATLGESLRSLEVEIGSVDGHDDAGERQIGDQANRARRVVSSATSLPMNNADASPPNVSEAPQDPGQAIDEGRPTENQQATGSLDTGSIDPTFLDALPEELRAEVLSAQQHQVAQSSNEQPQSAEEIDPEFLAALPPDIRAEVLAQQQAQRLHSAQELEGQPVEMDTVSIIATFPSDLREEVLLTSSDAILANLTPALVAEANMLRERFAHRYHSRALFGIQSRSRRGESSARGETASSSLDRVGGIPSRRSGVGKVIEAGGAPLVDTEALKAIVRLLRIFQPLYKGQLQRLLLNLCAHRDTRSSLVQLLMDMLMLDVWGPTNVTASAEPSYRLYGCQNSLIYSRPQFLHGVPPMVSRRVLETLTYLTKNHPQVARLLLHHQLLKPSSQVSSDRGRGKAIMGSEEPASEQYQKGDVGIVLLLSLLNQPLYLRSVAHLEQLLNLLEVIIDNAERNSGTSEKAEESKTSASQNIGNGAVSSTEAARTSTKNETSAPVAGEASDVSTSSECCVLQNLPGTELRLLCSLLAKEGLSDPVYGLVAEVLKKLVAIAPIHCHLFIKELAGSVRNLMRSAMDELHGYGESEITLVSMDLTDGTAILRVLQALSSLVSSLVEKEKDVPVYEKEQNDAFCQVKDINETLEPLWLELSNCISKIENSSESAMGLSSNYGNFLSMSTSATPPLPAGTQNILPYIESFFVACEKLHPEQRVACQDIVGGANSEAEEASSSNRSQSKSDDKHNAFVKFTEKHRKLLNAFIRQNPGLLEKSFSLMLKVPRFIDFDNKRAHFRSKIKHQHDHHHSPLRISVRRAYILEDSYNQLRMRSTQELKGRLTVNFQGEEGIDAGGLTREWYQLLSRVIFDRGALLFTTVGNESTFQPNPNSVYQTEHLSYFKFVGRVVGKALFDGQLLDVHFTRSFYKHILGVKVTYHDIEAIDPDFFKNLKWMLENDISDILDLTFSMDADEEKLILYERTEVTDYELIPGGRNVRVTEENKHEYVDLVAKHRLTTAIRPQINAFMEGFNELIPRDLISIFNDKELELLISGLPEIDLDDLRANTEYSGYTVASPVIQWFWEVVQSFSKEDKARLLQFVTGTSKVPLEGFSALQGISGSQRFQIHKAYGSPDHLPSAHTCFNQLDLPEYPSKQQLQERLLLAIHEGSEGFGFG
ncbi:E3 ubiquitin-protein ligase UPL1-like [Nymphaea colorata]|nr:E3 ubiquitin-protein ligase UPL1-like [Nymphaea colorata]XP_031479305.1 E3 ubiquitin-protein ligase UPL1-like [Nymphaea colorata]